ncbi:PhoX family phosphatase [Leptolyngbya sp. FACHB-261]|uniref:PhoX family protein n=1 Tax=Leptolyngbya sp. FACHB-261 TaxID=2692806 RepID=UPI0016864ADF|nr:alkaline phosphatase PhoX [Leptolyngbya sp. FACHB-261]MBD2101457.1 DUF839 domain-containing protein [Leptolyngbya sp. FACHB-261]
MTLKRRHFLMFLGAGAGSAALGPLYRPNQPFSMPFTPEAATAATPGALTFSPIKGPMPLATDGVSQEKQTETYTNYEVKDDLVLPEGFTYNVIAAWGDKVGDSRFGYNNDYVSVIETGNGQGYLWANFEYISSVSWTQSFQQVIGKSLPFDEVKAAIPKDEKGELQGIDAFALPDSNPLKQKIRQISIEALRDQGGGVIGVQKNRDGSWTRKPGVADRRITGISGLEDNRYLRTTGPSAAVFRKAQVQGYTDRLGDRIIGSFGNCSGGTTPWGTVLSAEENFQSQVAEPVHADGSSFPPSTRKFNIDAEEVGGQGNVLGLAGNKYGWIVEVDPANPRDYGTKHTWLGRFRHEAVGIRAETGKRVAFYSGCDRRGGHLYKFVSQEAVRNVADKSNSRLLERGMLYVAKFNANGTGRWIPLQATTPVDPTLPSTIEGGMITLPKRPDGGFDKVKEDGKVQEFKQQFKTLGDLYSGNNAQEVQGAILIDAHYAANAAGATCTARPEDTDLAADGSLYITFTSGAASSSDGGPEKAIFKGPDGSTAYEYGFITHLIEEGNDPAAMNFRWRHFSLGGEPAEGGMGFANPDNLLLDKAGNIWMVTDMSSDKHNRAVPSRVDKEGKPVSQSNLRGLFGNNSIWFIPTSGASAGQAYLFGYGPTDSETTGPFFSRDEQTLFLAVQHPGEVGGIRKDMADETRQYAMRTVDGKEFMQTRKVPIGSNWPAKQANLPPRPAVVAIRKTNGGKLT